MLFKKSKMNSRKHSASFPLVKRIVSVYLCPYIPQLRFAIVLMAISALMTGAMAWLMRPVLDDVLYGGKVELIFPVGGAILATFVTRGIATYSQVVITNRISQGVIADIQRDMFTRFITLDLAFFHKNPTGELLARVTNDVAVMRSAVTDTLIGFGKSFFTLIVLVAVMFYQDWVLSLIAFGIFPFIAIFVAVLGRRLRSISRSIQSKTGDLSSLLSQVFQGIRQVKAYGTETVEQRRAAYAINTLRNLNVKAVRLSNLTTPVNEVLIGCVVFGIVVYGGYQTASGSLTPGGLVSFIAAFTLAYEPMKRLARLNTTLQLGLGASERVFSMLDQKAQIVNAKDARDLSCESPDVTFEDVCFAYENDGNPTLDGVSFNAQAGKITALVGPSGAGKTTVMNLIPRFYDVSSGCVRVDGWDTRELTIETLRAHVALVSQDITIFDATIAENIAYGFQGATMEDVEYAAKAANAHEFILSLSSGYETQVGENGVLLSGGQRQRISIARALLRNAPILLLDEATSALDNESEQEVQKALMELERGRTTIVIAHRLSTVKNADKIIVMDGGKIAEQGRHDELIDAEGIYAHMYKAGLRRG